MSLRGDLIRRGINCTFSEVIVGVPFCRHQAAPTAMTTVDTITAAALLNGLIVGTHAAGATQAYTLPTGALLDAALTNGFVINSSFDFTIINLSAAAADTITLTASVGITIVGNPIIDANLIYTSWYLNAGTFRVRKTAADTFVAYRIS
jgi:hypothetical protein